MRGSNNNIFILPFSKISEKELGLVGSKAAHLGKLYSLRIPVPNGFVVTFNAFDYHIRIWASRLNELIEKAVVGVDPSDSVMLENVSNRIRRAILKVGIDKELAQVITGSYAAISGFTDSYVAVRSSLPVKDTKGGTYAGQYPTFLNVRGKEEVLEKVKSSWASLYSPQSLFNALSLGYDIPSLKIAVVIQKMVQSEVSGIMFTLNPINNDNTKISIEAVLGLGESLVHGQLTPDNYLIDKESGKLVEKHIVPQEWMLVRKGRTKKGENPNVKVKVSKVWKIRQKLENKYIEKLVKIGKFIEEEYGGAQEIEWAYEGGRIWIVQTRAVTDLKIEDRDLWKRTPTFAALKAKVESVKKKEKKSIVKKGLGILKKELAKKGVLRPAPPSGEQGKRKDAISVEKISSEARVLLTGRGAHYGIVSGPVRIISVKEQIEKIPAGSIIVISELSAELEKGLGNVIGIITNKGGRDSYAPVIARKLGVPAIIDTQIATKILRDGETITLKGETGEVLSGGTPEGIIQAQKILQRRSLSKKRQETTEAVIATEIKPSLEGKFQKIGKVKTATKIYVNIDDPQKASNIALADVDGVGWVSLERVILKSGIHPRLALTKRSDRNQLVNALSIALFKVAKSFEPRPVIYKLADLLSSDYLALNGGGEFETGEDNPLLGLRGASRFIAAPDHLKLELEALRNIRNKENLRNVAIAVPFVRTFKELLEVKKAISGFGFRRSSTFKLFMIAQVPAAVIRIEKLLDLGIDGVIIDLDELAQTILAADKANPTFGEICKNTHSAVLWSAERVIKACNKAKVHSQVRGTSIITDPKVIKKVVAWGVTSISTNPDVLKQAHEALLEAERSLIIRRKK